MTDAIDTGSAREALRSELTARGYAVQSDTMGARGGLYLMGAGDVAKALFEFRPTAEDAIYDAAHQGQWGANMPPRFAVLPSSAAPPESLETLIQMRAIPLLFDVVGDAVTFRDLDELLAEHLPGR